MRGNFDQARELYRRSRATLEELGWNFLAALTSMDSGAVEMLAGDPVAAERELRGDYEALHRMGEKNYVSTTAALLADALYQQRRFDEAEALAAESERLAARDDVVTQVLWRSVRAKVRAQQRRAEEAQALGHEAVDLLRRSEAPEWQGNALMDLAEILRLSGNEAEAAMAAEEAAVLFERKGSIVSLQRARGFLTAVHA
jgi:ATP/maltotriose-dependent transcriptional regulator MalT